MNRSREILFLPLLSALFNLAAALLVWFGPGVLSHLSGAWQFSLIVTSAVAALFLTVCASSTSDCPGPLRISWDTVVLVATLMVTVGTVLTLSTGDGDLWGPFILIGGGLLHLVAFILSVVLGGLVVAATSRHRSERREPQAEPARPHP